MTIETYNFIDLIKKDFKDFEDAKEYYKLHLKLFKKEGKVNNFIYILSILHEVQGDENFKKITGFDYTEVPQEKGDDLNYLIKYIKLSIILNGKKTIKEKTGLTIPTINKLFKPNSNITINTLNTLIEALGLKYTINLSSIQI